jgi:Holliday junction resolvase RusA-like endonuclease
VIYIPLVGVPLTTNHAYYNQPFTKKGIVHVQQKLRPAGKKYKTETKGALSRDYPSQMLEIVTDGPLGWAFVLDFPDILNKGWPKKARTRYKKFDVSNRVKLLEDALSTAVGMDDSQFFLTLAAKREGRPFTHIWMWKIDEEGWIPHGLVLDLSRLQPHRALPAMSSVGVDSSP